MTAPLQDHSVRKLGLVRVRVTKRYKVQLTIIGQGADRIRPALIVAAFRAECLELLECAPKRDAWQFECFTDPIEEAKQLAATWPNLKFLVFYEKTHRNAIAIAVVTKVKTTKHQIGY
jgi:hypothetical protein